MKKYKVAFTYSRNGYLEVEADNAESAVLAAQECLNGMAVAQMEEKTQYLEDSAVIDGEDVIEV